MPVFVHLTSHRNIPAIRRSGIDPKAANKWSYGVYALPVTRNFQISHQWLRELRRSGGGTILGVYFRIPDEERVEIGHYNSGHIEMSAAEAAAMVLAAEQNDPATARAADQASKAVGDGRKLPSSPEGFEVIIPRRIAAREILRVKALPQVVGWRYMPGAHGSVPCVCMCCEKGGYGVRRLQRAVEKAEAAGRKPKITMFGRDDASYDRVERMKAARKR